MTTDHPAQSSSAEEAKPFGDLAANVEGDLELLGELAGVFLRECPDMMGALESAIERRNPAEVEKAAHKLKGCVGVFTNRGPFESALNLEMAGREDHLADAGRIFHELDDQIRVFCAELKKCLAKTGI